MIEQIVKDFLTARLGVPIKTEVPESPPGTFVVFGAHRRRAQHRHQAMHAGCAELCAELLQAAQLDDRAIEAMEALAELDSVGACRLVRDYNFTDTGEQALSVSGGV
mgnify:CR=1 FL=1